MVQVIALVIGPSEALKDMSEEAAKRFAGYKTQPLPIPDLLPPKFSGSADVNVWLNVFEHFAADNEWDDRGMASKIKQIAGR